MNKPMVRKPMIGNKGRTAAPAAKKFQYQGRTAEQVRERATRSIGGRDDVWQSGVQFFTPAEGDNTIRILPPPPDSDWGHYGVNYTLHYDIGPDGSKFLCAASMKDEPCPICEERDRASSAGEQDLADELKPQFRVAVYVIDRAHQSKGPLLWNISAGMDKDITKLCIHPKSGEILPVDHPDEGYDLSFSREGSGLKTKYKGWQFDRKPSPLTEDADDFEKWLDHVVQTPLDSMLQFQDYDYIAKAFSGTAPPAAETEEPESPPPVAKEKPVASTRPRLAPRKAAEPEPPAATDVPTWDELLQLDEDGLVGLGDEAGLQFPEEGFDSIEAFQEWIAGELQIEIPSAEPEPAPAAAAKAAPGSWKDRLAKHKK